VFGGNDFTSNSFAQTPRTEYALRGSYELPLPKSIGTVALLADYTYRSHVFYTDTAQGPTQGPDASQGQDGYGLLNLRAEWRSVMRSKVDLALYAKNVTAKQYNTFGVMVYPSLGYNVATIGEPRIVGLDATFRF